ncbi:MAG: hypothetical protein ACRC47_13730, partial [Shewanella sp.]
ALMFCHSCLIPLSLQLGLAHIIKIKSHSSCLGWLRVPALPLSQITRSTVILAADVNATDVNETDVNAFDIHAADVTPVGV